MKQQSEKLLQILIKLHGEEFTENSAFCLKQVLNGMCHNAKMGKQFSESKLSDTVADIKHVLEGFTGSEVQDTQLQRKTEFAARLETQITFYEAIFETVEEVMHDQLGEGYRPYTKAANPENRKKTAAAFEAKELLARMEAKQAPKAKAS